MFLKSKFSQSSGVLGRINLKNTKMADFVFLGGLGRGTCALSNKHCYMAFLFRMGSTLTLHLQYLTCDTFCAVELHVPIVNSQFPNERSVLCGYACPDETFQLRTTVERPLSKANNIGLPFDNIRNVTLDWLKGQHITNEQLYFTKAAGFSHAARQKRPENYIPIIHFSYFGLACEFIWSFLQRVSLGF